MEETIELQITTRLEPGADTTDLLEKWFAGALRHLWPEIGFEVPADWAHEADFDVSRLFPSSRSATVDLFLHKVEDDGEPSTYLPWTEQHWVRFLTEIPRQDMNGQLALDLAGDRRAPVPINIRLTRNENAPDWVYFTVNLGEHFLHDQITADRILSFLKGFANISNPTFGHVSPIFIHRTALETLLRRIPDDLLPQSRQTLRGYSWVTVCSQEIGDRLGGLAVLRASRAFAEVDHLRAGGYWLLATRTYAEYDMMAAERIFRVLAPALPPGMPYNPATWRDKHRYLVVIEDAASLGVTDAQA